MAVVTVDELRRGVELIQRRGDEQQATRLEAWLNSALHEFRENILPIDEETAQSTTR